MKIKPFDHQYSRYYNLFYADKDYQKEVTYVDSVIKDHHPKAKTILEYGSGTGGHGILLNERGYSVYGLERSEEMAHVAKGKGLACEVADITDFNLSKKFDVCISLFHVISYINANDQLIKVFENTKAHLHPGGFFIFDVWYTPAVLHQVPETRVKRIENSDIDVLRIATPDINYRDNIVGVNYHIILKDKTTGYYNEFKETHNMRHFGVPELDLIARQTGFELLKAEEFLTGASPSTQTWGVNFIMKSL